MEAKELHDTKCLHEAVRTEIGQKLRAWYDNMLKEYIPDRQADLLQRLDEVEGPRR